MCGSRELGKTSQDPCWARNTDFDSGFRTRSTRHNPVQNHLKQHRCSANEVLDGCKERLDSGGAVTLNTDASDKAACPLKSRHDLPHRLLRQGVFKGKRQVFRLSLTNLSSLGCKDVASIIPKLMRCKLTFCAARIACRCCFFCFAAILCACRISLRDKALPFTLPILF